MIKSMLLLTSKNKYVYNVITYTYNMEEEEA